MDSIKILTLTWNVGNKKPDEAQLGAWLPATGTAEWDLVVVGTQECAFTVKKNKPLNRLISISASKITMTSFSHMAAP